MPTLLDRAPVRPGRNLGTLNSSGLNRPGSYPLGFDAKPRQSPQPFSGSAYSTYTPRSVSAPRPQQQPAMLTRVQPNVAGMTGFARTNTLANAGIYEPGSFGAQNAVANGTGRSYQPPQQTERANPLTGDNNLPPEGATTSLARVPFVQRGAGVPAGQDALPAPIMATETEDDTIAGSMAGTQSRIGGNGAFARRFSQPGKQSAYDSYLKRISPRS